MEKFTIAELWQDNGTPAVKVGDTVQIIDEKTYEEIEPNYLSKSEQVQKIAGKLLKVEQVVKHDSTLFSYIANLNGEKTIDFFDWEIEYVLR